MFDLYVVRKCRFYFIEVKFLLGFSKKKERDNTFISLDTHTSKNFQLLSLFYYKCFFVLFYKYCIIL